MQMKLNAGVGKVRRHVQFQDIETENEGRSRGEEWWRGTGEVGVQEEGGGTLEVVDTWTDCWAGGCWD